MKGSSKSAGFTIVETLIVLAVISILFVAITTTMSGRQNKTEFTQSIQEVQSKIQETINEVSSGVYPSNNDYKCVQSGATLSIAAAAVSQGKNQDCVFLGKVMQFGVPGGGAEQVNTFSIAGIRTATTLATAAPTVIVCGAPSACDTVQTFGLQYGLTVKSMTYGGGSPIAAVGFISEMGNLNSSGAYVSGGQRIDLIPITGTTLGSNEVSGVSAINSSLPGAAGSINPSSGVAICFQSGTTSQTALLTIGSNGHDLAVKMVITPC